MKRYSAYKQTEYDWLPEVPEHWIKKSIREITQLSDRKNGDRTDLELLSLYRDYGVIPKLSRDDNHNVESEDLSKYRHVKKHNLVINKMKAWQGSLGISDYEGIVSPAYIVCDVVDTVHSLYFHHLLRSKPFKTFYNRISYGVRVGQWDINYTDFKTLCVYLPPLEEQKAIADFLDKKTKQIDRFISLQKEAISLLKELRQAEITKAVTKGLDENAEMKDSGVEWIGEIPEGWYTRKLSTFSVQISKGATPKDISKEKNDEHSIHFIKSENIVDNRLSLSSEYYISEDVHNGILKRSILSKNDILFVIAGSIGKVAIMDMNLCPANINQAVCFIRIKDTYISIKKYIWYVLQSNIMKTYASLFSVKAAQPNISMENVSNFKLAYTDNIDEIAKIVSYLDKKCSEIDSAIQNKEALIEKVIEYKTRLISDAVTGKIDVRGEAI